MNGEIPSVPITTLAGIASLTDLLPEMPLPSPLPLSNKSLLFHPRVAEEARNLLSVRDESLVPQLIQSLSQTSSQHIELKDHYAGTEPPVEQQQNIPELLKAILHRNPNVFKGPPANVSMPQWNQNFNCNDSSPASYSQGSPNLSYSSPAPGYIPQDQVPGPVPVPIPPPDPGPQQRVSVITEQYKTPSVINNCEVLDKSSVVLVKEESVVSQVPPRSGGVQGDLPNSTQEPSSIPRTNAMHIAGSSPAQASTAPVTQEQEKSKLLSGRQSRRTNSVNSNADAKVSGEASSATVQIPEIMKLKEMKEPVVRLNRLSEEDQALMQKSLKAFAEKSPSLANKLGIAPPTPSSNHRSAHNSTSYKEDSGSDSDEPLQKSKYFKAREREREVKRQKDKDDRKKARANISDDDEYVPDEESTPQSGRKRRHGNSNDGGNQVDDFVPKTKLRKVERKVAPAAEKLSVEELMETNTYQRFIRSIEMVFDNTEDLDLNTEMDDGMDVPPEALIPKYQLQELCSEAAKLKNLGAMESIPADRLVRLLNVLEKNIRDGVRVCPLADPDEDEEESKLWLELAMERVMRAVDASLTSMYILTSPNMPKRIYLEDVIDRVVVFCKFQLVNTIYPSFDPVYRVENKAKAKSSSKDDHSGSGRKKRQSHGGVVKDKSIQTLYNKIHELVGLLSELLNIQVLTDTAVLHASTLGVAPFFVEGVNELQLSALRLVTSIFTKYEKHRRLLLDDILASIARLPSSKRSLRTYRLSSDEHIQMLTALVLQLIQCVVVLPEKLQDQLNLKVKEELQAKSKQQQGQAKEEDKKEVIVGNLDRDVLIVGKYDTAMRTAANFLSVFLNKCGNKSEEIDYRPLFENFVQDLLTTVNKPEWPAAELLLSLLGTLLVNNFVNKGTDMALRVASLDYLGVVAARLRKDAVQSQLKVDHIDQIIREIKAEESKEEESSGKSVQQGKDDDLDEEEERTQFLQRVLLDYLAVNGHNDQALIFARHFYLAQWYKDTSTDRKKSPNKSPSKKKSRRKKRKDASSDEESDPSSDDDDKADARLNDNIQNNSEKFRIIELRKNFLVGKIRPFRDSVSSGSRQQVMQTYLDYTSAELITRFLASKRPFSHSFDVYLKQILRVLTESSIAIRTKAMKCLTMVVEADPGVLGRVDMQLGVRHSFLDHSTSVREAAVDLVGKFVLSRPELIDTYYEMLSVRILDTGVSVRKRVIKILKDICIECPDFPKIPEICVKMIRRVNDEEGIRKLVMEVFQNMWFTPVRERPTLDTQSLIRKVMNITDVVATSREIGMEWFEQLLVSLFRPREDKEDSTKVHAEPPKALLTACKQIVDCLIENVLRLEESNSQNKGSNQRLVACLTTLNLFAKIRPQLLVNHAITLQPYLSLKCQTQGDYQIISSVARTLELVVPLMEHPSETFLAQLEEDSVKLILLHDRSVVASCLSCLGSIVNNVTRNFKLIRDCFNKYYGILRDAKEKETFVRHPNSNQFRPLVRRALFTVGLLLRHFDFTDKDVIEGLDADIKNQVFETLMYFVSLSDKDIQFYTLRAIGSLCIRHYEFMLQTELKTLYHNLLTTTEAPVPMRVQVLNNIEMYLEEEEQRMIRQDQEWAKMSKRENLKEMGDVTSGMASTVIQLYLKEILEAFLHPDVGVRHAALKVIQLILAQGLVHPVQIVPYLICMSTDMEKVVSHSADKQLQDIEKKYPGFIHMKSQQGIRLSFKLHCILQQGPKGELVPVRGFRHVENEPLPTALNGFLYSILRSTKQQRRALVLSVLKQFDEQAKTSLSQMLYYADNLAYFPYQVQDEPLFIIHHVDIMISVTGTNLMQTFREALIPLNNQEQRLNLETGQPELVPAIEPDEDEDEDPDALLARVPANTSILQEVITSFQGCLLLLVLKQHLKDLYGFTDAKITQYSPSEAAKVYEKAVSRRSNAIFNPKATLSKLKENPSDILDDAQRKALISQYLDFKQMMLKFDPDDAEEDEEGSPSKANVSNTGAGAMPPPGAAPYPEGVVPPITLTINTSHSDNSPDKVRINNIQNDGTPQRVPKLTIVAPKRSEIKERHHRKSHKSDKHKKHRHKKKRKKYGDESDDDSEEFSDPDFLA